MAVKQDGMIAKQEKAVSKNKTSDLNALVRQMLPEISKALPSVMTPERFTRIALTALSSNHALAKCEPKSFLGAMMQAAQLGLEPNTPLGQAYLIPYRNGKTGVNECQFQLGYKGMVDLVHRSGQISTVGAYVVYKNDEFQYELGLEPVLKHKPKMDGDRGEAVAYYAYYKTKDGGFGFEVMSAEDARKHGSKFSKSYRSGPWQEHFDEMAKKTVLKKALKYAPVKSEFARAMAADGGTITIPKDDTADLNIAYVVEEDEVEETSATDEMPAVDPNTGEVQEELPNVH